MNKIYKILFISSIIVSIFTGNIKNFDNVIFNSLEKAIRLIYNQGITIILWSGILNVLINQPIFKRLNKISSPIIHLIFPNLSYYSNVKKIITTNFIVNLIGIGNAGTSLALQAIEQLKKENDYFTIYNLTVLNTSSLSLISLSLISYRKILNGTNPLKLLFCQFLITIFSIIIIIINNNLHYKSFKKC